MGAIGVSTLLTGGRSEPAYWIKRGAHLQVGYWKAIHLDQLAERLIPFSPHLSRREDLSKSK